MNRKRYSKTAATNGRQYQQVEAFALMTYSCPSCSRTERIWNSRDAVTPFAVKCPGASCSALMRHILWNDDERRLELPEEADRVFVNLSAEEAFNMAVARLRSLDPSKLSDREFVERLTASIYDNGEIPRLISAAEYKRRQPREAH